MPLGVEDKHVKISAKTIALADCDGIVCRIILHGDFQLMKCPRCGAQNNPKSKFCSECGGELNSVSEQALSSAGLVGKEVDVLFFTDTFTNKIGGIVAPTSDQIGRYKGGIVQKVIIQAANEADDTTGAVLTFIKQSKDYLGEDYNENTYKGFTPADLKKEYLKLFERVLKMKAQRNIGGAPPPEAAKS